MNKQSTRAFAAGIFLSAIILIIFSFFIEDSANPKSILEEQGYVILTSEEAKKRNEEISNLQEQVEALTQDNHEDQEQDEDNRNEANITEDKEITLTVSPGMTPKEISDELESSRIIRNASDLNSYLVNSGLADKIQIGEYKLHSDMTLEEISDLLTN
jgi:hypothetical protein